MKTILRISLVLNLIFLAGLICLLSNRNKSVVPPSPALTRTEPVADGNNMAAHSLSDTPAQPFRWSQLEPGKDYRAYIANLRAIGCPESTVEDIVRGDAERTFAWERQQLNLDGTGSGPWSKSSEMELVADLLGQQHRTEEATVQTASDSTRSDNNEVAMTSSAQNSPSYPLFLQNPNWTALGFTSDQQAVIARVRQQFESEISGVNQNPAEATRSPDKASRTGSLPSPNPGNQPLTQWQKALGNADNQLRDLLGAQGYMAYEQQQYNQWYQPQVVAANAGSQNLTINPGAFSLK